MKAVWNNQILAQSDDTVVVEGNHYFPLQSLRNEYFEKSTHHSSCPWKGKASYYNLNVDGKVNKDAAWYYPEPSSAAGEIKNHVAFWKGVEIVS